MELNKSIKIAGKEVGDGYPCFVIAEAGSNHNRIFKRALQLIDVAKEAGADAVKFQIYTAESLYSKYLEPRPGQTVRPFDKVKEVETPREWLPKLAEYCRQKGIIFFASPFDREAVDILNSISPAFKWASMELTERPLMEYAAEKKKPFIVSTGFYGMDEVENAVSWIKGQGNNQIALLHCTGLYPCELQDINLRAMTTLKEKFGCPVGFSDHSMDTVIPAAAVAMGANIVEKHFTLDRKLKGPDHGFALEPDELKAMIRNIRNTEKSLGSRQKNPVQGEVFKEEFLRRGIVATKDLFKGHIIGPEDITTKRVGKGAVLPKDFSEVLGRKLLQDVKEDENITWKMI